MAHPPRREAGLRRWAGVVGVVAQDRPEV